MMAPRYGVGTPWGNDMLTNTRQAYGWLTIALHWLAAAVILYMLWSGFNAEWAGEAGDRARRSALMGLHIGVGASMALILLARVIAHYVQPAPEPPAQPRPLAILATVVHHALLIGIVLQIISGPLAVWSGGRAIDVFGLLSIPTPFAARNDGVHEAAELIHGIGRWTIIAALMLHLAGVLKHAFLDRDGVLGRMLVAGKTLKG